MTMFKNTQALIVGCGEFGARIASALFDQGFSVTVIDMREEAFEFLNSNFDGETVTADGSSAKVLEECGIERCGFLVAATGQDSTNFLIAEIASELYQVEHIVPRIEDESLIDILTDLDINPICPHLICMNEFFRAIGLPKPQSAYENR